MVGFASGTARQADPLLRCLQTERGGRGRAGCVDTSRGDVARRAGSYDWRCDSCIEGILLQMDEPFDKEMVTKQLHYRNTY